MIPDASRYRGAEFLLSRWSAFVLVALATVLCVSTRAVAQEQNVGTRDAVGSWKDTSGGSASAAKGLRLAVMRDRDDNLRGRVEVSSSGVLQEGNVEGRVTGHTVWGTVSDDEGRVIVRFTGSIGPDGIAGTYRDRNGGAGSWSAPGKALLAKSDAPAESAAVE
jgi:hypothetical protein